MYSNRITHELKWSDIQPNQFVNNVDKSLSERLVTSMDNHSLEMKKPSLATKIAGKYLIKKAVKIQANSKQKSVKNQLKVQQNKASLNDFSWLWTSLILLGTIFFALLIGTLISPLAGLISFLAMLFLLYMLLPDELGDAIGQAAVIMALNVVLQLLLSSLF